jgi:hypothetical protein
MSRTNVEIILDLTAEDRLIIKHAVDRGIESLHTIMSMMADDTNDYIKMHVYEEAKVVDYYAFEEFADWIAAQEQAELEQHYEDLRMGQWHHDRYHR